MAEKYHQYAVSSTYLTECTIISWPNLWIHGRNNSARHFSTRTSLHTNFNNDWWHWSILVVCSTKQINTSQATTKQTIHNAIFSPAKVDKVNKDDYVLRFWSLLPSNGVTTNSCLRIISNVSWKTTFIISHLLQQDKSSICSTTAHKKLFS